MAQRMRCAPRRDKRHLNWSLNLSFGWNRPSIPPPTAQLIAVVSLTNSGTVPKFCAQVLCYLSEQKSRRHWNNVAIACCSDSGSSKLRHGVLDSGNAMYNTRTDQPMLCPRVACEQSHSLKPLRNSKPVPKSNPWIQEATESYVTFRRNIPGRD